MNHTSIPFDRSNDKALPTLLAINFFPSFFPPLSGGEQRSYNVLEALSHQYRVVSFSPTYAGTRNEIVRFSPQFEEHRFRKTRSYERWHSEFKRLGVASSGADLALSLSAKTHGRLLRAVAAHWEKADVILLQHPTALPVISGLDLKGKRLVYLSHNCEFDLATQRLIEKNTNEYLMLMAQLEYRICHLADHIAVVSKEDEIKLRALYGLPENKFVLVGNGSICRFKEDEAQIEASFATKPQSAVFVGSNWPPNVEAAQYIVSALAPDLPEMTFNVIGSVCNSLDQTSLPQNVNLRYEVDDLALGQLLFDAHIGLNPMASGGGSNVKIADYLAHGLRVVTTPVGARGFPSDLPNCHVVELKEMAATLGLLTSSSPSASEREEWRNDARHLWHWPTIVTPLTDLLRQPAPVRHPSSGNLIVLNEFPVRGSSSGGEARVTGLYQASQNEELTVILSFGREHFRINHLNPNLVCIEIPASSDQKKKAQTANARTYSSVNDLIYPTTIDDNPLWLQVADLVLANSNGIVFSHPFMWPAYEYLISRRYFVHDSHNVESQLKYDALETHTRRAELVKEVERQESAMIRGARLIAACSSSDADYFRNHGSKNVIIAENGTTLKDARKPTRAQALDGEPAYGHADFYTRNVYLFEEFADLLSHEFVEAAYRAIIGRMPTQIEAAGFLEEVGSAAARGTMLVSLMASEENNKRAFVVGARRAAGCDEMTAVFIGSGHRPNLTAAEFLVSIVAPEIPEIQLLIVGHVGESLNRAHIGPNVFMTGFVSQAMKSYLLTQSILGLNPIIGGGGSNLKVPDYIAHGLPVVSSDFGRRGFALTAEQGLFSAPLADFARRVAEVARHFKQERFNKIPALEVIQQRYDWGRISEKYLRAVRAALTRQMPSDLIVVCEDISILGFETYGHSAKLVTELADRGRVQELVVQSRPIPPQLAKEWKARLPASIENVTLAISDREHLLPNPGDIFHDNILWSELDVVRTTAGREEIIAACARAEFARPVVLSGAGYVVAADHPWRFVTNDVVVALPDNTHALVLSGKAHQPTMVEIGDLHGKTRSTYRVHGNFELRHLTDANVVRIETRLSGPETEEDGSLVHIQLSRVAGATAACEIDANLWINSAEPLLQLGLPSECIRLINGQASSAVSQELQIQVTKHASASATIMCLGSRNFTARINQLALQSSDEAKVIGFDGANMYKPGAEGDAVAVTLPMDDVELGIARNAKERSYLASPFAKPNSVLLLCQRLNSEIVRLARALNKQLGNLCPGMEAAIVCADGVDSAYTGDVGKKIIDGVVIIYPRSKKSQIAILGNARLVVVTSDTIRFSRINMVLELLSVPSVLWRTGDESDQSPFADMISVSSVEEIIEQVWREGKVPTPRIPSTPISLWPDIERFIGRRPIAGSTTDSSEEPLATV